MSVILKSNLPKGLDRLYQGKVRDIYESRQWLVLPLAGERLFMVATDRISAFDVILPSGIPHKGQVLTLLSAFWFQKTAHLIPNHFLALIDRKWLRGKEGRTLLNLFGRRMRMDVENKLAHRSMVVRKVERIPIECVVRGYLSGSAWAEYQKSGTVSRLPLPEGLKESQELPQPLFTPTTKAETGHDQPLTMDEMKGLVGEAQAEEIKEKSLAVYSYAREYARARGIIIADTKMEFGLDDGELILIDELLTPDSSRFWDAGQYKVGQAQPSYDKQPVRDWLVQSGWNKEPPAPMLPPEVIEATTNRYRRAYERLTGRRLAWRRSRIMELDIGSNIIRNTSGVLDVVGKRQISLEFDERDQLLLTMDIYDSAGSHIARLRRNAWVFNNKDRFAITTAPASLKLQDKESGETIVEANVTAKDRIRIHNGRFYTHKGHLLEITPKFWRIAGGITISDNIIDGCGTAVAIR